MSNEVIIRLSFFLFTFLGLALWETASPRRVPGVSEAHRWVSNLGLSVLSQLLVRLLFPMLAVGLALLAEQRGWGLFNQFHIFSVLAIVACFLLLDLAIYAQHRIFHRFQWLWRLHRVHHTDLDFDVTTAVRFHPIEIVLSMLIKMGVVVLLGAPPVSVLFFELALNITALFNHSNIYIPPAVDRLLRRFVVTPDMHRVHHSSNPAETDSNFGFNLPWWDYAFNTYCAQPAKGHNAMTVGLAGYKKEEELSLPSLLSLPFREH